MVPISTKYDYVRMHKFDFEYTYISIFIVCGDNCHNNETPTSLWKKSQLFHENKLVLY